MRKRCMFFSTWMIAASLVSLAACLQHEGGNVISIEEESTVVVSPGAEEASNQPGSEEPGKALEPTDMEHGTQESQPVPGQTVVYRDSTYNFSVAHPSDFRIQILSAADLVKLEPEPVSSFTFKNPATVSSDIAELEPADLEIRLYDLAGSSSLTEWLEASGLKSGATPPQPFKTPNESGIKLCLATMLIPNCSYFVTGENWVFRLIPTSIEGEGMIETFKLLP